MQKIQETLLELNTVENWIACTYLLGLGVYNAIESIQDQMFL